MGSGFEAQNRRVARIAHPYLQAAQHSDAFGLVEAVKISALDDAITTICGIAAKG